MPGQSPDYEGGCEGSEVRRGDDEAGPDIDLAWEFVREEDVTDPHQAALSINQLGRSLLVAWRHLQSVLLQ